MMGIPLVLIIAAALFGNSSVGAADRRLPDDSIYHLSVELESDRGGTIALDVHRGYPVLVTMLYATCPHVCPTIISTMSATAKELGPDAGRLRFLAISIDPARDTPMVLRETMVRHRLDERWVMSRPALTDVRTIAGVLGVKYKLLPNGEFDHTSKIMFLNESGQIVGTTEKIGRVDPALVDSMNRTLE